MNLLTQILSSQNGALVEQLANKFGLNGQQAQAAVSQLVPALARGFKNNASNEGGMEALMSALQKGNHSQYFDKPETMARPETTAEGNGILGHIFGSKDVSRQVANHASEKTGIGAGILKQMLPLLASAAMGALSKQSVAANANGSTGGGMLQGLMNAAFGGGRQSSSMGGTAFNMLSNFLDADNDGSALDDIFGMITKRAS